MKTLIAVAACCVAAPAFGQIQTQSFSGTPSLTETLTFNQFNGNFADLIGICITMELTATGGSATVDNDGVLGGSATVQFGVNGSLSSGDVSIFPTPSVSVGSINMFNLAPDNGDGPFNVDGTGPDGAIVPALNGSDSDLADINAAFWGDYVGGGTFDILATVNAFLNFSGLSGLEGAFTPPSVEGSVTVEYKVIPAPASVAMLGLAGLAATRRRR